MCVRERVCVCVCARARAEEEARWVADEEVRVCLKVVCLKVVNVQHTRSTPRDCAYDAHVNRGREGGRYRRDDKEAGPSSRNHRRAYMTRLNWTWQAHR